jgi:hypothetical protein
MYDVVFYDRSTRHVMAGSGQFELLPDPTDANAPSAIKRGDLAQAWDLHDRRKVHHFNGERWLEGPLPRVDSRMHGQ